MNAAHALLDLHRVPRQIVVNERVGELQVAAFSTRLGAEHDRRPVAKFRDGQILLLGGLLTGKNGIQLAVQVQQLLQMRKRAPQVDEDEQLVSLGLLDQFQQPKVLRRPANRCGEPRQFRRPGIAVRHALQRSGHRERMTSLSRQQAA